MALRIRASTGVQYDGDGGSAKLLTGYGLRRQPSQPDSDRAAGNAPQSRDTTTSKPEVQHGVARAHRSLADEQRHTTIGGSHADRDPRCAGSDHVSDQLLADQV